MEYFSEIFREALTFFHNLSLPEKKRGFHKKRALIESPGIRHLYVCYDPFTGWSSEVPGRMSRKIHEGHLAVRPYCFRGPKRL